MKTCLSRLALIGTLLLCPGSAVTAADAAPTIDFNRDIRPILSDNCFACHGPDQAKRKARLRLDTRDDAVARGLIIPGNHAKSPLFERLIATDDEGHMPPRKTGKRLSSSQVKLLGQWIDLGAPYSRHWAYIPPRRPVQPVVKAASWARNPIDRFVLHRLEQEGLHPSPETDRATLLRRVTLDLTGLPPTLDEIDAFLADQRPDAYERVVDRLLASPHHGERMAQHWLDLARYADTNGYRLDNHRDVWRWRDWVIDAFNANMPFDQFTIEQLAGDLLPRPTLEQRIATGFHRNTMVNFGNGSDPKEYLARAVMDRVATTGTVWLGTTFGCVQCHDHKYDPFTQKDYYRLFAFFNNVPEKGLDGERSNPVPSIQAPTREQAHKLAILQQQRAALAASLPALRSPLLATPFFRRLDELKTAESELLRAVPSAMVMEEMPRPRTTRVLLRGDYLNEGEVVTPGVPASLPPLKRGLPANRLDLARWLVDSENPLTARVTVNRLWQFHFGTGLVRTGDDFGSQGEPPSHPELLDWLATEFVRSGWDLKAMHRLIVTSATYRQSSRLTAQLRERDPDNRLLARAPRLRLDAETIRDSALTVSGLLVRRVGGPSVKPYQPAGLWEQVSVGGNYTSQRYVQDSGHALYRRGLYVYWKRSVPNPALAAFDAPTREACTERRPRTNTPLQALVLMNDTAFVEAARVLAQRTLTEGGPDMPARLEFAFRRCTGRAPTSREREVLARLLAGQLASYRADRAAAEALTRIGESPRSYGVDIGELAAWTSLASLLLNLDEFITRE